MSSLSAECVVTLPSAELGERAEMGMHPSHRSLMASVRGSFRVRRKEAFDLITRWQGEGPIDVSALLEEYPHLGSDKSILLDLIYEEFCQRADAGEAVSVEDFCNRFPGVQNSLRKLLATHQFLYGQTGASSSPESDVAWPKVGETFLGFNLRGELGRGTFARVFLAAEPALGERLVAIKIAFQGAAEAATLGRLHHPNIVSVHSVQVDRPTGLSVVCMPYLGSATLGDVLDKAFACSATSRCARVIVEAAHDACLPGVAPECQGSPDPRLVKRSYSEGVAWIGLQLADALAYTHAQGICHLDLKPSNVLVSPSGRPMLLDFNLSFDPRLEISVLGGTLPYMAPEQLRALDDPRGAQAQQIGSRSDLFALGVILYELLTGALPFGPVPHKRKAREIRDHLLERQEKGPIPVRQINPRVEKQLAEVIERCLALRPEDRVQSAAELAGAFRAFLSRRQRWARFALMVASILVLAGLSAGAAAFALREPYLVRHMNQGTAAYRQQDYDLAIRHLNLVIERDQTNSEAHFARGRAHQKLAELRAAEAATFPALSQERQQAFKEVDQRMGSAEADYRMASELGQDPRTLACLGYCQAWLRYHASAAENLKRAIDAGYAPAEVYNDLAFCYIRGLQDFDKARLYLAKAKELNPNLPAIQKNEHTLAVSLSNLKIQPPASRGHAPLQAMSSANSPKMRASFTRGDYLVDPVKDSP